MSITLTKLGQLTSVFTNPENILIVGNYAYIVDSSNDSLTICDISNPYSISVASTLIDHTYLNYVVDLYISGNYCYVITGLTAADNYLTSIDISNVYSPVALDHYYIGYNTLPRKLVGNSEYVYIIEKNGNRFKIVDITDPSNLTLVETKTIYRPIAIDLSLEDNYLYICNEAVDNQSYLNIYSISIPDSPVLESTLFISNSINKLNKCRYNNNYLYISSLSDDCIYSVNVSDPTTPVISDLLTDATNLNGVFGLFISGTFLYATCAYADSLAIIDISDPTNMTYISSISGLGNYLDNANEVYVVGDTAYVVSIALSFALVVIDIDIDPPTSMISASMYRGDITAKCEEADYADQYAFYYSTQTPVTKANGTRVLATTTPYTFTPSTTDLMYIAAASVNGELESKVLSSDLLVTFGNRYRDLLLSLFPTGKAWTRDITSNLAILCHGLGTEFNRIAERAIDFLDEVRPSTTNELISYFEDEYGIPDDIVSVGSTLADRRSTIVARMKDTGRNDRGYWQDELATELGFTVIFIYHRASYAGIMKAGDRCCTEDAIFYTTVAIYYNHVTYPGEALLSNLYALFERYKQVHNILLYNWYGPAFSTAFSNAFDSMPYDTGSYAFSNAFDSSFNSVPLENSYLWTGAFSKAFNNSFNVDRSLDLTGYFNSGAFDTSFSIAFDRYLYAYSR